MITKAQLELCIGTNKVHAIIDTMFKKYDINTKYRMAGFLAQCGHESNNFKVLKENLNYSASALVKVFKKYFKTEADANAYARNQQKIANRVYANRMGNGTEASGDGWKYRGRGAIQLTGKNNYIAFAKSINMPLEDVVAYMETVEGAIESACWYWKINNLNAICDKNDILAMTKKINGGTNGLDDRTIRYNKYLKILST